MNARSARGVQRRSDPHGKSGTTQRSRDALLERVAWHAPCSAAVECYDARHAIGGGARPDLRRALRRDRAALEGITGTDPRPRRAHDGAASAAGVSVRPSRDRVRSRRAADVGGTTGLLEVDTGDPLLLLNPVTFPGAPYTGSVGSVRVGSDTLSSVPVVASGFLGVSTPDPAVPLGGLLGCTVLCTTIVSLDYRDTTFTLGGAAAPANLLPEATVGFPLKGGGRARRASASR